MPDLKRQLDKWAKKDYNRSNAKWVPLVTINTK